MTSNICLSLLICLGFAARCLTEDASGMGQCEGSCTDGRVYEEQYRLQYHFSPEQNWMNDPCGLIYFQGEYHHFYQYNPYGDQWGNMHWGHSVSTDLVHWQHLPLAILEEDGVMIFTGSSVYDVNNTSGLGQPGTPPLVAVYTGYSPDNGNIQDQRLAYSLDNAQTYTKYSGNPVLDIGSTEFRDPMVFWYDPDAKWKIVVALSVDHIVRVYESEDLKQWTALSDFQEGEPGRIWECPNLFQLAVDGDPANTKWVLQVSVNGYDAVPTEDFGIQYFIGDFNGTHFINDNPPDTRMWLEQGRDFYAPHSFANIPPEDGRRIWMGWFNYPDYAALMPVSPWRGSHTIPRELTLKTLGQELHMCQTPISELQDLRTGSSWTYTDLTIDQLQAAIEADNLTGNLLEIRLILEPVDAVASFGISLLKDDIYETVAGLNSTENTYTTFADTRRGGEIFDPHYPAVYQMDISLDPHGHVDFIIYVDQSSVEVFAASGSAVFSLRAFPLTDPRGVAVFGSGVHVVNFEAYELSSIWMS